VPGSFTSDFRNACKVTKVVPPVPANLFGDEIPEWIWRSPNHTAGGKARTQAPRHGAYYIQMNAPRRLTHSLD
jgi:hypothetical protein